MRLDKTAVIAGVPVLEVRRLLRTFALGFGRPGVERLLRLDERAADALVTELEQLGLIEATLGPERGWVPTTKGNALAGALALSPMRRAKADKLLARVLDRVRQVNASDDFLYYVTRVEVFGSYLSDTTTLNDLDIAIELRPRDPDKGAHFEACEVLTKREMAAGRRFATYTAQLGWQQKKVWRYLKARSPRVSLHELDELSRLGTERRTLFVLANSN